MALTLTDDLIEQWQELDAELRQQSFFDYLTSTLEIWGLQGDEGWIMSIRDEVECLPIWSHSSLASKWQEKFHPNAKPSKIGLNDFKTVWLPGLKNNDIQLLVGCSAKKPDAIAMSIDEFTDALS